MSELTYQADVMKKMVQQDRYLSFVYNDLIKRNHGESEVLEILFHSNIIGDSIMEASYQIQLNN